MENGFNTRCEQFRRQLINYINQSQLPISVVYFIGKDIFQELEKTYYATLNSEAQEYTENKSGEEVLKDE